MIEFIAADTHAAKMLRAANIIEASSLFQMPQPRFFIRDTITLILLSPQYA